MTSQETRIELWNAINQYASACGGSIEGTNSSKREFAVLAIERVLAKVEEEVLLTAAQGIAEVLKERH